jgi:hypothetical protein
MALLNAKAISFNDIRLILCVNGYNVKNEYVVREIGFWSRNSNSVIPFVSRITYNNLSIFDKATINYLLNSHHGIGLNKQPINGLLPSESCAVIKSIYHSCQTMFDDDKRKYIGYCDDINMLNLIIKCGLGHLAVNIKDMFETNPPSNMNIIEKPYYGYGIYSPCGLHRKLTNEMPPMCARVKSLVLAEWLQNESNKNYNEFNKNIYDTVE